MLNSNYNRGCKTDFINFKFIDMNQKSYTCPKCGNRHAEIDHIRTTGAGFTKYFNIQNRKFTAGSCSRCGYTEFYRGTHSGGAGNVLDFITS
jgi:predicted nucleic-acid-binding Zn-ribbon protein